MGVKNTHIRTGSKRSEHDRKTIETKGGLRPVKSVPTESPAAAPLFIKNVFLRPVSQTPFALLNFENRSSSLQCSERFINTLLASLQLTCNVSDLEGKKPDIHAGVF